MTKTVEVSVKVPEDMAWEDLTKLEDDLSRVCGEVLKDYGLARLSHKRHIESDYSARR